jgi:hypothetical protein
MRWEDYDMLHKYFADNRNEQSEATQLRRRRFLKKNITVWLNRLSPTLLVPQPA